MTDRAFEQFALHFDDDFMNGGNVLTTRKPSVTSTRQLDAQIMEDYRKRLARDKDKSQVQILYSLCLSEFRVM